MKDDSRRPWRTPRSHAPRGNDSSAALRPRSYRLDAERPRMHSHSEWERGHFHPSSLIPHPSFIFELALRDDELPLSGAGDEIHRGGPSRAAAG